eukprot:TRINITY_DN10568_c0_g1_i2.p1 TRINITY_DN10568_c0_g1~~TRINITY_DN10568_c0_g1_i2.p1  ORF type:complete len:863 (+),score=341.10 TRINITY_DN10568_c0_g1_i2:193-2781(+)
MDVASMPGVPSENGRLSVLFKSLSKDPDAFAVWRYYNELISRQYARMQERLDRTRGELREQHRDMMALREIEVGKASRIIDALLEGDAGPHSEHLRDAAAALQKEDADAVCALGKCLKGSVAAGRAVAGADAAGAAAAADVAELQRSFDEQLRRMRSEHDAELRQVREEAAAAAQTHADGIRSSHSAEVALLQAQIAELNQRLRRTRSVSPSAVPLPDTASPKAGSPRAGSPRGLPSADAQQPADDDTLEPASAAESSDGCAAEAAVADGEPAAALHADAAAPGTDAVGAQDGGATASTDAAQADAADGWDVSDVDVDVPDVDVPDVDAPNADVPADAAQDAAADAAPTDAQPAAADGWDVPDVDADVAAQPDAAAVGTGADAADAQPEAAQPAAADGWDVPDADLPDADVPVDAAGADAQPDASSADAALRRSGFGAESLPQADAADGWDVPDVDVDVQGGAPDAQPDTAPADAAQPAAADGWDVPDVHVPADAAAQPDAAAPASPDGWDVPDAQPDAAPPSRWIQGYSEEHQRPFWQVADGEETTWADPDEPGKWHQLWSEEHQRWYWAHAELAGVAVWSPPTYPIVHDQQQAAAEVPADGAEPEPEPADGEGQRALPAVEAVQVVEGAAEEAAPVDATAAEPAVQVVEDAAEGAEEDAVPATGGQPEAAAGAEAEEPEVSAERGEDAAADFRSPVAAHAPSFTSPAACDDAGAESSEGPDSSAPGHAPLQGPVPLAAQKSRRREPAVEPFGGRSDQPGTAEEAAEALSALVGRARQMLSGDEQQQFAAAVTAEPEPQREPERAQNGYIEHVHGSRDAGRMFFPPPGAEVGAGDDMFILCPPEHIRKEWEENERRRNTVL